MRRVLVLSLFGVLMAAGPTAPAGAVGNASQYGVAQDVGRFVISARPVALREGIVRVRVSCRRPVGCTGRLVLKRGRVAIGARRFDLSARRRNAVLAVRLTGAGVRALGNGRRKRITAVASVRFGDGTRSKPSQRFWLRLPSVS